ncbi:MAG: hypothetical protein AAFO77_10265, partial [Pseudomonadota bacterium]
MDELDQTFWASKKVLIFGAGFSGRAFGRLVAQNSAEVFGTTRSLDKAEKLKTQGINPVLFAGEANDELVGLIGDADIIIQSIAPDESGDPVINALRDAIAKAKPAWLTGKPSM